MTAVRLKLAGQLLALACVAGLLALLVWRLTHQEHAPKVGSAAPAFTLRRLDGGGTVSLASFRGKPVVLNFWASWCIPCKSEAKVLEQAWNTYRGRGVEFVGVDFHDVTSDARRFVVAHALTFPMLEDGSGSVTTGRYGVTAVPETYVVDREGRILAHLAGPITGAPFASEFRSALAKATAS
ncbi:MAG TPA: redoxin domain-containing protein [Gaiellaceae bacterium]|nr:redoxin domain-containing protein [Gaiellaceae bacterium]